MFIGFFHLSEFKDKEFFYDIEFLFLQAGSAQQRRMSPKEKVAVRLVLDVIRRVHRRKDLIHQVIKPSVSNGESD